MAQEHPTGSEAGYAMSMLSIPRGQTKGKDTRRARSKAPNAESLEAIHQAQTGEGLVSYNSVKEMLADLNDE